MTQELSMVLSELDLYCILQHTSRSLLACASSPATSPSISPSVASTLHPPQHEDDKEKGENSPLPNPFHQTKQKTFTPSSSLSLTLAG